MIALLNQLTFTQVAIVGFVVLVLNTVFFKWAMSRLQTETRDDIDAGAVSRNAEVLSQEPVLSTVASPRARRLQPAGATATRSEGVPESAETIVPGAGKALGGLAGGAARPSDSRDLKVYPDAGIAVPAMAAASSAPLAAGKAGLGKEVPVPAGSTGGGKPPAKEPLSSETIIGKSALPPATPAKPAEPAGKPVSLPAFASIVNAGAAKPAATGGGGVGDKTPPAAPAPKADLSIAKPAAPLPAAAVAPSTPSTRGGPADAGKTPVPPKAGAPMEPAAAGLIAMAATGAAAAAAIGESKAPAAGAGTPPADKKTEPVAITAKSTPPAPAVPADKPAPAAGAASAVPPEAPTKSFWRPRIFLPAKLPDSKAAAEPVAGSAVPAAPATSTLPVPKAPVTPVIPPAAVTPPVPVAPPAPVTPAAGIALPAAAKVEAPAPKVESAAPKAEVPAPKIEAPAPKVEVPAPKVEVPAPKAEAPAPKAEVPAPKAEAPAPKVEAPAPKAEVPGPKAETPVPPKPVIAPPAAVPPGAVPSRPAEPLTPPVRPSSGTPIPPIPAVPPVPAIPARGTPAVGAITRADAPPASPVAPVQPVPTNLPQPVMSNAPATPASSAAKASAQLTLGFEITSLQLTPFFKLGSVQLRPLSDVVSLHLVASEQADGPMAAGISFKIERVEVGENAQVRSLLLRPLGVAQPATIPQPKLQIDAIQLSQATEGPIQITPSQGTSTAVQFLATFTIASMEFTPAFEIGSLRLEPTSNVVMLRLAPSQRTGVELPPTFEMSNVQIGSEAQLTAVTLTPVAAPAASGTPETK